ncbi:MAG: MGMT family protein [Candidatus Woesearchaeota archaeon]|jgi:methylated-DNA-[protein]-cysteine S-methyltransferase|nr:MGMT family protein [Candidatus Woesearchaeota archaeon]MDP7458145.1 MGMT family protein [Candidatus Woesearchaeota archaeon]
MNFNQKVLNITKKIPKGKVTTYKAIAEKLNSKAYRAVGTALKNNPDAPKTSCHRVIASDGSLGGYCGKMNDPEKAALLRKEGVEVNNNKIDKKFNYKFKT